MKPAFRIPFGPIRHRWLFQLAQRVCTYVSSERKQTIKYGDFSRMGPATMGQDMRSFAYRFTAIILITLYVLRPCFGSKQDRPGK